MYVWNGPAIVQKFTGAGTLLSQFGSFGSGDGQSKGCRDMATDDHGNLFVLDERLSRVSKFGAAVTPTIRATWGGLKTRYREP